MKAPRTKSPEERLRALLGVAHALGAAADIHELCEVLHREATQALELGGVYVSLRDRASARERVGLRAGDASGPEALSFSINFGDLVLGTLVVEPGPRGELDQADQEWLRELATLAALAIRHIRQVEALERQQHEARGMEQILRSLASSLDGDEVALGILTGVREVTGARDAAILVGRGGADGEVMVSLAEGRLQDCQGSSFRPQEGLLSALELGAGVLVVGGWEAVGVFQAPSPLSTPDDGLVLATLGTFEDRIALLLVSVPGPSPPSPESVELIRRLADHGSVALRNAHLHAELRDLSLTDPLTGLPNRRHLEIHLGREFAAAQRGRALSLVLLDLDRFKEFNDSFGHPAGDRVLTTVATVLQQATRSMNLVARYGGDEFVAVLSTTPLSGARTHVDHLEAEIARHPGLAPHGIRLSAGIAEFDPGMASFSDLIQAADEDMYRTKWARRDDAASARPSNPPGRGGGE